MKKKIISFVIASMVMVIPLGLSTVEAAEVQTVGVEINGENFPDEIFRATITEIADTNEDGYLSEEECKNVTFLNVNGSEITNLQGVEYFVDIYHLECRETKITELDVSKMKNLESLHCDYSPIEELNVEGCEKLEVLSCDETNITTLDMSSCSALKSLAVNSCLSIETLDVTNNTALTGISCQGATIEVLDIRNCVNIEYILDWGASIGAMYLPDVNHEVNYSCGAIIAKVYYSIPNVIWETMESQCTNSHIYWNLDEENVVMINEENFPDAVFRNYIATKIDSDGNGELTALEIQEVDVIDVGDLQIHSLQGMEFFTNVYLISLGNIPATEVDLSYYKELRYLSCSGSSIKELDLTANVKLESLLCQESSVEKLDITNNPELNYLIAEFTNLTELDVTNNPKLETLTCAGTGISEIDVTKCPELIYLFCSQTRITELDLSQNKKLQEVICYEMNLTQLDTSKNADLERITCFDTNIEKLDVSKNTELTFLQCSFTRVEELDVSNNLKLQTIGLEALELEELDLRNNTELVNIQCYWANIGSLYLPDLKQDIEDIFFYRLELVADVYYPEGNVVWETMKAADEQTSNEVYAGIHWYAIEEPDLMGDVNGDGSVMANDAMLVLQAAAGIGALTEEQVKIADVSKDGVIMSNDAMLILQMAAGIL